MRFAMLNLIGIAPAISEARIVLDMGERRVDVPEFLADAFDESAHIGAKADFAVAGHETFTMHDVVKFTVAHIVTRASHQMVDDLEFGLSQFETDVLPEGAIGVAAQLQIAMIED